VRVSFIIFGDGIRLILGFTSVLLFATHSVVNVLVWLYLGAWHEWNIHEIDMAVAMSPDQVLKKRYAIFFINFKKME
jgi:hypothetical protein